MPTPCAGQLSSECLGVDGDSPLSESEVQSSSSEEWIPLWWDRL